MRYITVCLLWVLSCICHAQTHGKAALTWIDKETGHKVVQLTPIPYSTLPYFTVNAVSSDQKTLFFTSPQGIHALDLESLTSNLLLNSEGHTLWFVGAARRSNRVFYLAKAKDGRESVLEAVDIDSKEVTRIATIPEGYRIETLNADDTLAAGVFEEEDGEKKTARPERRAVRLYTRAAEKRKSMLFVIDLRDGVVKPLYQSSEWLSHPLFSPRDPSLLMYSIEGPWHLVDRIWLIRSDGSDRKLVHRRTMQMEIVGHEFWSGDGTEILYDWQFPKGRSFFIAAYNVASGQRTAYPLNADEWSLHINSSTNPELLAGDGASRLHAARSDKAAYIRLYKKTPNTAANEPDVWGAGAVRVESLVDMGGHDYKLEPNVRLTPKNDWVLFRSNMFGAPSIFAVQTAKADKDLERRSTRELSESKRAAYRNTMMIGD